MSDATHLATPPTLTPETILDHFGFKGSETLPLDITKQIMEMVQILSKNNLDPETSLGLLKSYETKSGQAEEQGLRVKNFLSFIKGHDTRDGLLNSIKSIGFFSKAELEKYGADTGDWAPFLRRIAK